jgi:hypothetical protein
MWLTQGPNGRARQLREPPSPRERRPAH